MYTYDGNDQQFVRARAAQFQDQVGRRLTGSLNEDEFRPLRLMNGLYLEMHAYMLRIGIPYGGLSADQLHALASVADKYDRGYGHFTTRQNVQFNWLELEQVPEVLKDLAGANMHAIQSSGSCIRSITSDPYAGVAKDELSDPRPTAELIRQWSSLHPEFAYLGRKFKIAVTGSDNDRASIRVHDIGVQLVENNSGEPGYKVFVGGGLGRTPMVAVVIREFLAEDDLLAYLEAILRVYNLYGRRDNKYKARIKILTKELGIDKLREQVDAEFAASKDQTAKASLRLEKIRHRFITQIYEELPQTSLVLETLKNADDTFARWVNTNIIPHKVSGYAIANISLKPIAGIPGDVSSRQMRALADLAERFSLGELRVTQNQSLALPYVKEDDLGELWRELQILGLAEANTGLITDIVSCPGMDYCSLATARSIPIAQQLATRFADPELQKNIGQISVKISGCINACGHHHVANIGILGLEKNGQEFYQVVLGGSAGADASIGNVAGPGFSKNEVVDAVARVISKYLESRTADERFSDTFKRIGAEPFKEVLYETH